MSEEALYVALVAWAERVTGLTCIRDNQPGPRPAGDYVMVNLIDDGDGEVIGETCTDTTTTTLSRVFPKISVHCYARYPVDIARKLRASLKRAEAEPIAGFCPTDDISNIRRIPVVVQSRFEGRAHFDFTLSGLSGDTRDTDRIETILIEPCAGLNPVGVQPTEVRS